jgi:hypothetical protein
MKIGESTSSDVETARLGNTIRNSLNVGTGRASGISPRSSNAIVSSGDHRYPKVIAVQDVGFAHSGCTHKEVQPQLSRFYAEVVRDRGNPRGRPGSLLGDLAFMPCVDAAG